MKQTKIIALALLLFSVMATPASADFFDDVREAGECTRSFARQIRNTISVKRITNHGQELNGPSSTPSISDDGLSVAFESRARNVIPRDRIGRGGNVFLWKVNDDRVRLVSHAPNGDAGNDFSQRPQISPNGKFIVFHSKASNLVEGDNNNKWDVFLYDVDRDKIERVSIFNGMEGDGDSRSGSVSVNGKVIAFHSRASNWIENVDGNNIYVTNLSSGTFSLISRGLDLEGANGDSLSPHLSEDGEWVVFASNANNLVEGDRNRVSDIFVNRVGEKAIRRVSVASDGTEGNGKSSHPRISRDGLSVIFESDASNLVEGDTNDLRDIFRHDLSTGQTVRLLGTLDRLFPIESNGRSEYPDHSMLEGGITAFHSEATNLATNFGQGGWDMFPEWVQDALEFFGEEATIPLLPEDRNGVKDIYIHLSNSLILRGSINAAMQEGNGASTDVSMAQQAPMIVFSSAASNLVDGDRNRNTDIFVARFSPPVWECGADEDENARGGNERGGAEEPIVSCQETDGGPDPYLRGLVIIRDGEGNIISTVDHCCDGSKRYLEEVNCVDGSKQTEWYRCTGCRNGACIRVGGRLGADRLGREPRDCR